MLLCISMDVLLCGISYTKLNTKQSYSSDYKVNNQTTRHAVNRLYKLLRNHQRADVFNISKAMQNLPLTLVVANLWDSAIFTNLLFSLFSNFIDLTCMALLSSQLFHSRRNYFYGYAVQVQVLTNKYSHNFMHSWCK